MQALPAASPGVVSGNLRKRIQLLQQVQRECTISGVPWAIDTPWLIQCYREHLEKQIEWLYDELAVSDAQLELALFAAPAA